MDDNPQKHWDLRSSANRSLSSRHACKLSVHGLLSLSVRSRLSWKQDTIAPAICAHYANGKAEQHSCPQVFNVVERLTLQVVQYDTPCCPKNFSIIGDEVGFRHTAC